MPTYEYTCTCGRSFSKFGKPSDMEIQSCPKCGEMCRRLVSGGCGTIYKGTGFHSTDYRDIKKYNRGK